MVKLVMAGLLGLGALWVLRKRRARREIGWDSDAW
jgi:hypothetical protein